MTARSKTALILIITLTLTTLVHKCQSLDDLDDIELDDFDFDTPKSSSDIDRIDDVGEDDNADNNLDTSATSGSGLKAAFKAKEQQIQNAIFRATRNDHTSRVLANIFPIIRYMSPEQKLAFAAVMKSQVLAPADGHGLNLDQVKSMFGSNENMTSQLLLPISLDMANIIRRARRSISEEKPEALELRGGKPLSKLKFINAPFTRKPGGPLRRNIVEHPGVSYGITKKPLRPMQAMPPVPSFAEDLCEQFTNEICVDVKDYPLELILGAIRRNKGVITHLLADYKNMKNETDTDFMDGANRRVSDDDRGFMCTSEIKYARPKKAKATSGNWKFIVNTPEHTQTLRLEKCLNPEGSCSYLTDNFKSRCQQVYNYHRLLTWDKKIGLHMDIFKVPSCCSCHVEGYKATYPPHIPSTPKYKPDTFPGEEFGGGDAAYEEPNSLENGRRYRAPGANTVGGYNGDEDYYSAANSPNAVTKSPHNINDIVETTHYGNIFNTNSIRYQNKHPPSGPPRYNTEKSSVELTNDAVFEDDAEYVNHNHNHRLHKNHIPQYLEAPNPGPSAGSRPKKPFYPTNGRTNDYLSSPGRTRIYDAPTRITPDPSRGLRPPRRQPPNRFRDDYDLEINESDPKGQSVLPSAPAERPSGVSTSTQRYDGTSKSSTEEGGVTKRINYNYHPILDFFSTSQRNPTEIQRRADIDVDGDRSGWRPITKPAFHGVKGV